MNIKYLLLILVFFFCILGLQAQWVQTNGPDGGDINCMTKVGSEIWLGTPNGLYISSNEGLSWQKSGFLYNLPIGDIYCTGDTIVIQYCVPIPGFLFDHPADYMIISSFDGGLNWSNPVIIYSNFLGFYPEYLGKFKSCQSGLLYILPSSNSFIMSENMGLNWHNPVLPPDLMNNFIVTDGQRLLLQVYNTVTNTRNLLISEDFGINWINRGDIGYGNPWFLSDSLILYTTSYGSPGSQNFCMMRSTDLGINWDTAYYFPTGEYNNSFAHRGDTIFAFGGPVSYISEDNGLNWQADSLPDDFFINSIYLTNGDQLYYEGTSIERYYQYPGISLLSQTGFHGQTINSVASCNNKLYCSSAGNLYRSADGGQTWTLSCTMPCLIPYYDHIIDIRSAHDTLFCVNNTSLGRSFDNGLSWEIIPLPGSPNLQSPYVSIAYKQNRLYLSTTRFWVSNDFGTSWDTLQNLPNISSWYAACGTLEVHQNTLFTVTHNSDIFKLNEITQQWENLLLSGQGNNPEDAMLRSVGNILFLTGQWRVSYSTNAGTTWITPSNLGLPMHDEFYTYYPKSIQIYQGLWFGCIKESGVYYSSDQGNNWNPLPLGIDNFKPTCLTIQNDILYAGGWDNGVWRRQGIFYTCAGKVYLDNNNNGLPDPGEAGLNNINLLSQTSGWGCTTDSTGNYHLYTDAVGDTVKPIIPQGIISINPPFRIFTVADTNQNFGIYATPNVKDLTIDISNVNIFRPGFPTLLVINVLNKGSVTQASLVKFVMPSELNYLTANPAPISINGDTISWQLNNLMFYENSYIQLSVQTSPFTFIGDTIVCTASVFPVSNDTLPLDNVFVLSRLVQGSYDPNDKTCEQGDYFSPTNISQGKEMEFTIRFENTGNIPTEFVRIVDTLSPYLDWGSFRVVSATQPLSWSLHGQGAVEFVFDPLALQPSSIDELASIGFIKYAIKVKAGIVAGSSITNQAYIYFDFNPPILTNITTTVIFEDIVTQIPDHGQQAAYTKLIVYPNPAENLINLRFEGYSYETVKAEIFDLTGRLVKQTTIIQAEQAINIAEFYPGIYFGKIISRNGSFLSNFKFIIDR